jgi:hypothetical protein
VRFIYPDTSIWNSLCDQNTDPAGLLLALADLDAKLALGSNVVYEIAKQFFSPKDNAAKRGRELFAYINRYLASGIPILKANSKLLIEEAMDVVGDKRMESCFENDHNYRLQIEQIDKLCKGDVAPETRQFFEDRKVQLRTNRTSIRDHLGTRPDLVAILSGISEEALPDFIRETSAGPEGPHLLAFSLRLAFIFDSFDGLTRTAKLLLENPRYRMSRALTNTNLYLNWRCVNRGSIRGDVPDVADFHVLSPRDFHDHSPTPGFCF